ncbi:MAG: hypothetical protein K2X50_09875 [Gammaproteobacteria bacterium]|nr:hypothetical protein [Gammaproteobacteria bacterium]
MTVLSAIGIQTWRAKRPLPGAKPELLANMMQFYRADNLLLSVIYPRFCDKKIVELLSGFWRAIENAGHCSSESHPLDSLKSSNISPVLILGDDLAQAIKVSATFSFDVLNDAIVLDGPEKVSANPKLKATWWNTVKESISLF